MPETARPFAAPAPVRTIEDVRRIEAVPLVQALGGAESTLTLLQRSAAAHGDRPALTFLRSADPDDPPLRWSYRELLAQTYRTANLLHELGLGRGDTVGVLLPACLEYHLAHWGGAAAGVVQPLNPLLHEDKLAALLEATGARLLIAWGADAEAGYWSKALRLMQRVPTLHTLLRVAPLEERQGARPEDAQAAAAGTVPGRAAGPGHPGSVSPSDPPGSSSAPAATMAPPHAVVDFHAGLARQRDDALAFERTIRAGDLAAWFHTGGTTGAPKLARHTHGNQVYSAWASVQLQGTRADDVLLNGYPLFHVAGVLPASLAALSAGAEVVIPTAELLRNRAVLRNYWKLVERWRVTVLPAVPTVLAALVEVPLDGADISSLRYVRTGAAPLAPELAARFERRFGLHVHESLGMTETAGISAIRPPGVPGPAGCVGFVLPHARVRIARLAPADDGGTLAHDVEPGAVGEILLRSPNVFAGYLDPADTARAFTADGWLITGDLGRLDAQGLLHLAGRAKDLIIRSGHNIDPKTIEDALAAHPAVLQCAAVGAPDAYAGELPVAYAVLREGASATEAELLDWVGARVDEAPARPRAVTVVDRLPLTNVGKVYKPALRAQAQASVVAMLLDGVMTREGVAARLRPAMQVDAEDRVVLSLPGGWSPAQHAALLAELGRLPVATRVDPPTDGGSPAGNGHA